MGPYCPDCLSHVCACPSLLKTVATLESRLKSLSKCLDCDNANTPYDNSPCFDCYKGTGNAEHPAFKQDRPERKEYGDLLEDALAVVSFFNAQSIPPYNNSTDHMRQAAARIKEREQG